MSETSRQTCTVCHGAGFTVQRAFTSLEGRFYPERRYTCYPCDGAGSFAPPDRNAILAEIAGRGGKKLRSARPKSKRAYYVWRMARFHGGADVTMPITAISDTRGDPFLADLDKLADAAAKAYFGTDLAAAHRWGHALGYLDRDMPGLPDSAYSGGRVADADKPESEAAELI